MLPVLRLARTFCGLSSRISAPQASVTTQSALTHSTPLSAASKRLFSACSLRQSWLAPRRGHKKKSPKGRPRVPIGGSVRGTTVVWGDWGLRMKDFHRRLSAAHLQLGVETIKKRLRGHRFRLYTRVAANIGVFTKGHEMRMGKGKGKFDFWACRVAVSQILFEVKGDLHEKVVEDAFRLAACKLPGRYELARRGDPPVMGLTKLLPGALEAKSFPIPAEGPPATSPEQTASTSI